MTDVRSCRVLLTFLIVAVTQASLFDTLWGADKIFFPKTRCALAIQKSGFQPDDFANYPKYYHNDSILQLAQAGIYQGASEIEEYVKFVYANYSPYIAADDPKVQRRYKVLGYHNGQCEFLVIEKNSIILEPSTTNYAPPFESVFMVKIFLDFDQGYIKRFYVYYPDDFLRVVFAVILNSTNTRSYICEKVIKGPCSAILNITDGCEAALEALPSADGALHYIDGNSQGCRDLHAVFASTNPTIHCAHLSFSPLPDPLGRIKCQISKSTPPSDLFTESDFKAYREFARLHGIDPALGHNSGL